MLTYLKNSVLFSGLSDLEIEEFLDHVKVEVKEYEKDEFIFQEWEKPKKIFILASGRVLICKNHSVDKRTIIAQINKPSDMFGEVYAYMQADQYDCYTLATTKSTVLLLDAHFVNFEMKKLPNCFFKVMKNLLTIFAQKAYFLNQKVKALSNTTLRARVIKMLLQYKVDEDHCVLTMTREELADSINIARPSLSRELGLLQEEGLIEVNGKKVKLLNKKKLMEYCY